ncbi:MAG: GYDIA family GHMP kinase [Chitinophagales bacterium]
MDQVIFEHSAHGKLLLSGEYFVLDGAKALAIPTKFGQHFKVYHNSNISSTDRHAERSEASHLDKLIWKSFDYKDNIWFEGVFHIEEEISIDSVSNQKVGDNLVQLLNSALQISGLSLEEGLEIHTHLEFPNNWGLGSSSTLVASLAEWFEIDPFELLEESFGGSGYDLACATTDHPIFFQRNLPDIDVDFAELNWSFKDQVYFVYLGEKQNSREGIAHYRSLPLDNKRTIIAEITEVSEAMAVAENVNELMALINQHETLVSDSLALPKVKDLHFKDFDGAVKSLGAWGGDFVMAVSEKADYIESYFKDKGYDTVIAFEEMVF